MMGKELVSTEMAAKIARISYITLRRWLAGKNGQGELQQWLTENGKLPLTSIRLCNGKHVWQFSIENRRDLIEYRDLPERRQRGATGRPREEVRKERNSKRAAHVKVSPERRERYVHFRRYVKALVELRNIGFAPQDARLIQVSKQHVSESTVMNTVTEDFYAVEHGRVVETLGKMFAPERL